MGKKMAFKAWKHWKRGELYLILMHARHHETGEELIVYRRLDAGEDDLPYVRAASEWHEEVQGGLRRFTEVVVEERQQFVENPNAKEWLA